MIQFNTKKVNYTFIEFFNIILADVNGTIFHQLKLRLIIYIN